MYPGEKAMEEACREEGECYKVIVYRTALQKDCNNTIRSILFQCGFSYFVQ